MEAKISSLFQKALNLSISNLWRNKILSLATIFVIATILFIFNIILAINFITNDALENLNQKVDLVVYLQESTTLSQANQISEQLNSIEGVINVEYTSKDQALQQIEKTHPDITTAFKKYSLGNPLPASLNITTTHPSYHLQIAEFLEQDQFQAYLSSIISNDTNGNSAILTSVSRNLLSVTNFANQLIFWLILIFLIGGALIILNAIQITIFNRKKEVEVMKLVGASYWFIRLPFIIESIIYGICAVIVSFVMLAVLAKSMNIEQTSLFDFYTNIEFYKIFLSEIIITMLLSIFAAMIAVHEYLHTKALH